MYSTYKQVIDDIRFSVNEPEKLSVVNDETIQVWVNKWQHIICLDCLIENSFVLSLKQNQSEYSLNDALGKPETMRTIKSIGYVDNSVCYPAISVVDIDMIVDLQNKFLSGSVAPYPSYVAFWINNGKKFLKFFPVPMSDVDVRIYYYVTFDERYHNDSDLDDTLVISSDYETLLKYGVESEIYRSVLKDNKNAAMSLDLYYSFRDRFKNELQQSHPQMRVVSF